MKELGDILISNSSKNALITHIEKNYTLPRKKRNFSYSISPGDPGSGSVTQGHEHYQEWFGEKFTK